MNKQELREKIADYVMENLYYDEVVSVEDNAGGFWMTMQNGEVWYVQVGLCEREGGYEDWI